MPVFAAIDIGSNSCRLKIARVVNHRLKTLEEDREVTRLGASVFESGLVSPESMAATLAALKRFQRAMQAHGVEQVRVVATAAMRDARNASAFLAWAKAETGWNIEIISGLEEARLIHQGVMANEAGVNGRVMLVDVGGGSCEITLSEHKRIRETISLPLGAVRLSEEFLSADDPPTEHGLARLRQFIARELRKAHRKFGNVLKTGAPPIVIATSGTAAALSEARWTLAKNLAEKAAKTKAGRAMTSTREVRQIAAKLRKMPLSERVLVPGIGTRRAEIIVAGAWVLADLLENFGLAGMRYSDLGLRDGMLAQMLAGQDARAEEHQPFEHERWQSVLATAARFGVDVRHAEPVRAHAVQLFRDLKALHGMPPEFENLLAAAAMLRDVGKFLNHQGHNRHTQYIISSSEIYGYTRLERTLVSAIARYLGKSRPEPDDRAMRNIPIEMHRHVECAVVLLRLAVALNQDRASDVLKVTARVYPKRALLELRPGRTGAELELWSLRKEAGYFRLVFGRELFVTLV